MTRKVIIIGSGPAGYSAAVYLARAKLEPLVFAGEAAGGQLMLTTEVENYPGFPEGIMGPELMMKMREQAQRFGAEIVDKNVTKVDFSKRPFRIEDDYLAEALVIATGAEAILLGVPGEKELMGRGVSTCAVCDAAFYKDKVAFVVGGGDSAMEEALALTKFAKSITIIHRRAEFRASKIMQDRVLIDNKDKVKVLWNTELREVKGESKVQSVVVNSKNNDETELPADGVFMAIGHKPVTEFLGGQIKIDAKGYIVTGVNDKYPTMTSVEGVFAGGDVIDWRYKQAVTAAGLGTMAALDCEWWLEREKL